MENIPYTEENTANKNFLDSLPPSFVHVHLHEDQPVSPWCLSPPRSKRDESTTTTRFAQLLVNPVTRAVTATEVEQKVKRNFLFDDDWCFEKDEATSTSPRKQHDENIIPALELSSFSSSSCSSISSCTMSDQSEAEIWEELVDTVDIDDYGPCLPAPNDRMPFVYSTDRQSSDSIDDDSCMSHFHLLSDDIQKEVALYGHPKKRGCIRSLHLIRWKHLFLSIMEALDQEERALQDGLWYIWLKGNMVRCYGSVNKCTSYESI